MTYLKMAWSLARAHVSLIDGGGPENTASFQFQPAMIDNGTQWRFSRLSEEEMQNLIESKNSENTRKATKNAGCNIPGILERS